jgi:hypothetical protein
LRGSMGSKDKAKLKADQMQLDVRSKREQCPKCLKRSMQNHVLMQPGRDVEIYVECVSCGAFVARYTLKMYTGDDPYASYLRLMRQHRMSSGSATHLGFEGFREELVRGYERARAASVANEETLDLDKILEDL